MACRKARMAMERARMTEVAQSEKTVMKEGLLTERLWFGVDSNVRADNILQNNLTEFEWVERNKIYPAFWGRNIVGENSLTLDEIDFLQSKACRIAACYSDHGVKETKEHGRRIAEDIVVIALNLGIPFGTAIFLDLGVDEYISRDCMYGYAEELLKLGFIPGFKANTDSKVEFDREFSSGMQTHRDVFAKCVIWATAPSLKEYDRVTTTHFIHPDNWIPFAPSGITRRDIAVWQYGKECHPIEDDAGRETYFNVDLVRDDEIIKKYMF